jgi:hypothetical protein
MKLIKFVLSIVVAAGALTSAAVTSAAAEEPLVTAAQAFQQLRAQVRSGASVTDSAPFTLRVSGRGNGYCLDNFASGGGANNSPVGLWTCNGGITEVWRWRVFDGSWYNALLVNERSGRCLDYPASAGNNIGWQINVYDCKNGAAPGQNFHVEFLTPPDLLLTSQATSQPVALDAFTDFWHGDGSPVGLWTYSYPGNLFQHWY